MNTLRGLIRPVLTVEIVSAWLWGFMHPLEFTPERMALLHGAVILVLGFWFGERALKNLGLDIGALLSRKDKAANADA